MKNPKPKHTPGPWTSWDFDGRIYITPAAAPCLYVADINGPQQDPEGNYPAKRQREANAALIAAAPELLAALEAVHNWWTLTPAFQNGEDDMPAAVFDGIINAIAKAKGAQ